MSLPVEPHFHRSYLSSPRFSFLSRVNVPQRVPAYTYYAKLIDLTKEKRGIVSLTRFYPVRWWNVYEVWPTRVGWLSACRLAINSISPWFHRDYIKTGGTVINSRGQNCRWTKTGNRYIIRNFVRMCCPRIRDSLFCLKNYYTTKGNTS